MGPPGRVSVTPKFLDPFENCCSQNKWYLAHSKRFFAMAIITITSKKKVPEGLAPDPKP